MRVWTLGRHEHECHGEGHPPGERCEGIDDAYAYLEEGPWWAFMISDVASKIASFKIYLNKLDEYGDPDYIAPFSFMWRLVSLCQGHIKEVLECTMPMKDAKRCFPETYEKLMKDGYYK